MILALRHLLREPIQVRTRDMVMMPDLGPAHTGEEALRVIGASVVERVSLKR
jgi:hypothetical protein